MSQQQQQDPIVSLELPLSALNYALSIAAERPYKEAAPFIKLVQEKAQRALDAKPVAPADTSAS